MLRGFFPESLRQVARKMRTFIHTAIYRSEPPVAYGVPLRPVFILDEPGQGFHLTCEDGLNVSGWFFDFKHNTTAERFYARIGRTILPIHKTVRHDVLSAWKGDLPDPLCGFSGRIRPQTKWAKVEICAVCEEREIVLRTFLLTTRQPAMPWSDEEIDQRDYQRWIAQYDTLNEGQLGAMRQSCSNLATPQTISLIVPIIDRADKLDPLLRSIVEQLYPHWHLIIAHAKPNAHFDFSQCPLMRNHASKITQFDAGDKPALSALLNKACEKANGKLIAFLESQSILRPHALWELVQSSRNNPEASLFYSDADCICDSGQRFQHHFKPDANIDYLMAYPYIGNVFYATKELVSRLGGFREGFEEATCYDFQLRAFHQLAKKQIVHIPFILHHEVRKPSSEPRPWNGEAAKRALSECLTACGEAGVVEPVSDRYFHIRYRPERPMPKVSIVIPSKCDLRFLKPCVESFRARTDYPDYDLSFVISDIRWKDPEQASYLRHIESLPNFKLLTYENRDYNFSWVNNWGVQQTDGEIVCFTSDDIEPIRPDWLREMVSLVLRKNVGLVGPKLLYPNGTVQHAGLLTGPGGTGDHFFRHAPGYDDGYHGRAVVTQEVSGLTGACMVMRRSLFEQIGGWDERWPVAYNDFDLSFKVSEAGYRILFAAHSLLYHHESVSIGRHDSPERRALHEKGRALLLETWGHKLSDDPYYNPNLSLVPGRQWKPAYPPRCVLL